MPGITTAFGQGTAASRPAASSTNNGYMWFSTDTNGGTLYQSNGSSWVQIGAPINALTSPMTTKGDLIVGGTAGASNRLGVTTDGYVLTADSTQTLGVKWGAAVQSAQLLSYSGTSLSISGSTVAVGAWLDITSNQTFTVASGGSGLVQIACGGCVKVDSSGSDVVARLAIDSAGTPQNINISGSSANSFRNVLAGAFPVVVSGLSAAAHTVKLQVGSIDGATVSVYCRSSAANGEFVSIYVTQLP